MNKRNLTDRKLKELYYDNYTYKQIAKMYECSIAHVSRKVNKLIEEGYIDKRSNVSKLLFENLDNNNKSIDNINRRRVTYDEIMSLYKMNVSVSDIAKLLECSKDTVHKAIQKYRKINNIEQETKAPVDKEYILELYNKDLNYKQIAKITNVCLQSVFRTVNEAITKDAIPDRKLHMLTKTDKRTIRMYRSGISTREISRELRLTNRLIEGKIDYFINKEFILENYMMKNIFINNKAIITKCYKNGISCENIAWYLKISENTVREYIESKNLSSDRNIIKDMIKEYKPKEIAKKLNVPLDTVYLHLKDVI